jgi:hypothetical protein
MSQVPAPASRGRERVKIDDGPGEQRGLLRLSVLRGDAREGVEDHLVAALALIGRKIAFEHAAVGAKGLDAGFDVGTPCRGLVPAGTALKQRGG